MAILNKFSAVFDITLLLPFLIPGLNASTINVLLYTHNYAGLNGEFSQFDSTNLIFVSLLSAVSIMWGVVRFLRPTRFNLIADTVVRFFIAGLISSFVFFFDASSLFVIFIISELIMGVAQLIILNRVNIKNPKPSPALDD
jgi:hypothetical protein